MKAGIVKKLLSYIVDIPIEQISSDYNEELSVLLVKGRYQLCTPNAIYSYADKYDNFKFSFDQLDLDTAEIENVLLLGFGLGSIPYMLEKMYCKNYSYTGVEIDDAIIYLASKYIMPELKSETELIQADAYSYILQNNIKYDLICIDIFVDDKIPQVFLDLDFLEDASENLSENGFIMFNHLALTKNDIESAVDYFNQVFKIAFPNSINLNVKGNCMMISDSNKIKKPDFI